MSVSLKKLWNEYGIGAILVLIVVAYGVSIFAKYLSSKSSYGYETMDQNVNKAYSNKHVQESGVQPSQPLGQNEVFASTQGNDMHEMHSGSHIQNPAELLPKDSNSQWAQLNPSGKGELANVNLLKAGYHIGIDTIGSSLRNANLQIRSEPPNPQVYTGIWNQTTITPDFFRVPLEIGSGNQ